MLTYDYMQKELMFCGAPAIVSLFVELYPRDEWKDPENHISIAQLISEGVDGLYIRDIVTGEDHPCSFETIAKAFPELDFNNYSYMAWSGVSPKEGYQFDQQAYYEFKKRENLLPPGQ